MMKVFYCLLMCGMMYATQSTNDSIEIARLKDSIENKEKSVINYAKKIEQLRSKRIYSRLLEIKPISKKIAPYVSHSIELNNKAVRLEEYDIFILDERYRVEFVPKSWFGRLFSREKYKLKLIPVEKDTIITH